DAFASSTAAKKRKMREIAADPDKCTNAYKQDQSDLDEGQCRRDLAAETDRCTIQRRKNNYHHQRDDLESRDLERRSAHRYFEQRLFEPFVEKIVHSDCKCHPGSRLRAGLCDEHLHPAEEKTRNPTVSITKEHIFAAGLR